MKENADDDGKDKFWQILRLPGIHAMGMLFLINLNV